MTAYTGNTAGPHSPQENPMSRLQCLDLFSGIGGFALGFHRAGIDTMAFCDVVPHARAVLRNQFPGVPIFADIRSIHADIFTNAGVALPDIIAGGFPCQDLSVAGKGAGLTGSRSGLWYEMLRLVDEIRPKFLVAENVAVLRSRGLDECLRGLDEIRYDAEWHCIPASAVGAHHRRDRVWIVAYPNAPKRGPLDQMRGRVAGQHPVSQREETTGRSGPSGSYVAHTNGPRLEIILNGPLGELSPLIGTHGWAAEPDVGRVAYGVPSRVDRLTRLGNAVVPAIPEAIGRAIVRASQLQPTADLRSQHVRPV